MDIQLNSICKTYPGEDQPAVDNISLNVEQGELFGLIGPDGAGKTTLFRILTTLMLADSGEAWVNGKEVVKDYKYIRSKIGYMPGKFSLYQDLTVLENLQFFANIFQTTIEENHDLIKEIYVQIEPFRHRRAGQLSGGMKQKLALCCALIHRPTVLFLDEPTTGVDSVSRKEFWEMLGRLKSQGITIMVSTPYMDEAGLCERIALIQEGKILSVNTPDIIRSEYPAHLFAAHADDMGLLLKSLRASDLVATANAFGSEHHITLKDNNVKLKEELINQISIDGLSISAIQPSIEDCFINLM
ncbi:MAG: ABC transporter ATP-binding protein [Reichenbachiella sp.]|uniref:ABC transporter ATP-binding protein n=1 Tax=Reichenbachiella sp. TaxID=2184521 RepID=UPI003265228D